LKMFPRLCGGSVCTLSRHNRRLYAFPAFF
jgi:hypothetical protein